jgi:biotin operon repressor
MKQSIPYNQYKLLQESELKSLLYHLHYQKRLSLQKIANKLGCSRATISRAFKKYNMPVFRNNENYIPIKRYGFNNINSFKLALMEWRLAGYSKSFIAQELGCRRQAIIRCCKQWGIP